MHSDMWSKCSYKKNTKKQCLEHPLKDEPIEIEKYLFKFCLSWMCSYKIFAYVKKVCIIYSIYCWLSHNGHSLWHTWKEQQQQHNMASRKFYWFYVRWYSSISIPFDLYGYVIVWLNTDPIRCSFTDSGFVSESVKLSRIGSGFSQTITITGSISS